MPWWESWIWCWFKLHLSSGCAGSYHLGGGGAENGRARAGTGWGRTSSLLGGHHNSIRCVVWSQVAGAKRPEGQPELALFSLTVCFSLSPHWDSCPRGEGCWSKGDHCGLSGCAGYRQRFDVLPVQVLVAPLSRSLGCKSPLLLTADHCLQPLSPALLWNHSSGQAGPHGLSARARGEPWWGSCCQRSGLLLILLD